MKRFVIRQNIEHYRAMLTVTTDPAQRPQIEKLLHEEEAKLKKYDDDKKDRPAPARRLNQTLLAPVASRRGHIVLLVICGHEPHGISQFLDLHQNNKNHSSLHGHSFFEGNNDGF